MDLKKSSKYLAKILRHDPESAGVFVDEAGWAETKSILRALNVKLDSLKEIVSTDSKGRYSFDCDFKYIRANQGHSINVPYLELTESVPPDILYHGTATKFLDPIFQNGIQKMDRNYVHLSSDYNTAVNVGKRHGSPIVIKVFAKKLHDNGRKFYISHNGVWLVDFVPSEYIEL